MGCQVLQHNLCCQWQTIDQQLALFVQSMRPSQQPKLGPAESALVLDQLAQPHIMAAQMLALLAYVPRTQAESIWAVPKIFACCVCICQYAVCVHTVPPHSLCKQLQDMLQLKSLAGVLKVHSHSITVCNLFDPWSVWQYICQVQAMLVKDSSQVGQRPGKLYRATH